MTKHRVFWIASGLLLALLLVFGSVLIKHMQTGEKPAVILAGQQTEPEEPLPPETSQDEAGPSNAPSVTEQTQEPDEPSPSESDATPVKPTAPPTTPPTSGEIEDLQGRIDALLAEVYALREYYTAQLAYLEADARAQYEALSYDKRTKENKQSIALDCIEKAYALEDECDSRMDDICSELGHLLLRTDGDMNLISQIQYAYAKEKETAKNQFIERYADYFG